MNNPKHKFDKLKDTASLRFDFINDSLQNYLDEILEEAFKLGQEFKSWSNRDFDGYYPRTCDDK